MNAEEQRLNLKAERIKLDAPEQNIPFADQKNAFTVWCEQPNGRMLFSGRVQTHEDACSLAAQHVNKERVYIVVGEPTLANFMALRTP